MPCYFALASSFANLMVAIIVAAAADLVEALAGHAPGSRPAAQLLIVELQRHAIVVQQAALVKQLLLDAGCRLRISGPAADHLLDSAISDITVGTDLLLNDIVTSRCGLVLLMLIKVVLIAYCSPYWLRSNFSLTALRGNIGRLATTVLLRVFLRLPQDDRRLTCRRVLLVALNNVFEVGIRVCHPVGEEGLFLRNLHVRTDMVHLRGVLLRYHATHNGLFLRRSVHA